MVAGTWRAVGRPGRQAPLVGDSALPAREQSGAVSALLLGLRPSKNATPRGAALKRLLAPGPVSTLWPPAAAATAISHGAPAPRGCAAHLDAFLFAPWHRVTHIDGHDGNRDQGRSPEGEGRGKLAPASDIVFYKIFLSSPHGPASLHPPDNAERNRWRRKRWRSRSSSPLSSRMRLGQ